LSVELGVKNTPLDLTPSRLCGCPENKTGCLEDKEWMKNMIGIWEVFYEAKDIRNKSQHPATFPLQLARRVIKQFSHPGELMIDPICGSGTSLVAARELDRNALGFEIHPGYVALTDERLRAEPESAYTQQLIICEDAFNGPKYIKPESASLIFTSPPYADLLNKPRKNKSWRADLRAKPQYELGKNQQYSQDSRDFGNFTPEKFITQIMLLFRDYYNILKPGGSLVLNILDPWREGKRVNLHSEIQSALSTLGYIYKNLIIWDKRKLVNGSGIFGWPSNFIINAVTYEFLLHFEKPREVLAQEVLAKSVSQEPLRLAA
jgi:DNA modification methylase